MNFCLPETMKVVEAITPQVGAAITGDYVCLKDVHKAWVVVHIEQGDVAPMAITLEQATNVLAGGSVAITVAVPIWLCEDCATTDLLVRQTDAVAYTTSAGTTHKVVVFQVDPATFSLANADCLTVITAASNAANLTSAMYYLYERYGADQPPSAIID